MTRWWLVPASLLVGCTGLEEQEVAEAEQVRDEMVAHEADAAAMRDALIQGDLDTARSRAEALQASFTTTGLPEEVLPIVTDIRDALKTVASAKDLTTASEGAGKVAQTCGRCHTATRGGPEVPATSPPAGDALKAEMARHQWAAERMWLGLVRNDGALFNEAVAALAVAPLLPGSPGGEPKLPPLATELEQGAHELALAAASASTPAERGKIYGDLLVTCATCHTLLRDAPSQ